MSDKAVVWGPVTQEALIQYAEDMGVKFLENVEKVRASGKLPEDANWLEVYATMDITVQDSIRQSAQRGGDNHAKIVKKLRQVI